MSLVIISMQVTEITLIYHHDKSVFVFSQRFNILLTLQTLYLEILYIIITIILFSILITLSLFYI
jgi:hypothetical protein